MINEHDGLTSGGETIFAMASGGLRAGVAVVRVSGPDAARALATLDGNKPRLAARKTALRRLIDPLSGETLDEALVLFFKGPGSFTGEDVVELHLHGGPAVVEGC